MRRLGRVRRGLGCLILKWFVMLAAALVVVAVGKRAMAAPDPKDVTDSRNWEYLPGYRPGTGTVT